jgi:hypothetical protein
MMQKRHERTSDVAVHRRMSEGPVTVRQNMSAEGRSTRRRVSLKPTLRDQVRNLRMELSDLKIQVSDLAAHRT